VSASPTSTGTVTGTTGSALLAWARARAWALGISLAMASWVALLFGVTRHAFLNFRTGRFDLGNMAQAVWSTANGRPLEITDGATGEQMIRLGGHVDPFLALLAPLWVLWPSPLVLALAQIVVVSLGALPVFWLGRRHLSSDRTAGLLALAYLAYPWVGTSAAAAIHPVTFAITFLLFCVWFLDTDRLVPFSVFAVVVPAARGEGSVFYGFYDTVGGSPLGVVRTLFTHPGTIARALIEPHDIVYLVWLGLPLLFVFLLSPGLAAVAIPQLLANGLSDFRSMTDPRYHSVAAVIPFLIAATVLGIARLRVERRTVAAAAVLVCSATIAFVVGPWPRTVGATPLGGRETPSPAKVTALRDAVALVPSGASVSASNGPGAHLSDRQYVYSVPNLGRAEWVVVDLDDPWIVTRDSPILTNHPGVVRGLVSRLSGDPAWRKVFERDDVVVFRATTA
jgi:uncharacterized membrane protein